ncbi:MAG: TIGR01212 family radical SAM protein [Marinilabiliales bacterium]|nr:MAG: TIGR01212 family radical SAM protein [Marinilabiliales bacterium]
MTNTFKNMPWNDYSSYIKRTFGQRVQKISVNAGFTCPNRDGKISKGACIYCTNKSFSPFYCNSGASVREQLEKGIAFFSPKYKTQKYLAYFQSFTNTYGDIDYLKKLYLEALSVEGVEGFVIATRPDCIDEDKLMIIKNISKGKYISIEYGAESTIDKTLVFINRGHSYQQTIDAVELTAKIGINTGLHMILGLPGENEEDFYHHAKEISKLPINTLKVHQMQVLKETKLAQIYNESTELFFDLKLENYILVIVKFLEFLNPNIIVERFTSESPKDMIIYPDWKGKKNFEISHMVMAKMKELDTYQGKRFVK